MCRLGIDVVRSYASCNLTQNHSLTYHTTQHVSNSTLTQSQVMKDEMELVQEMENVDDRNSELYIDKLARILAAKSQAIGSLRQELLTFQQYRSAMV